MLQLRRKQIDLYYPGSGSREAALAQLVEGALAEHVLRINGIELDRAACIAERDRIDSTTRAPELLRRIRAVYAGDDEAYLNVSVLPDLARKRLDEFYRNTPRFSQAARAAASAFLDEVAAAPDTFAERARARAVPSSTQKVERNDAQLCALLRPLKPGAVHPNTLETADAFEAVRLISRKAECELEIERPRSPNRQCQIGSGNRRKRCRSWSAMAPWLPRSFSAWPGPASLT